MSDIIISKIDTQIVSNNQIQVVAMNFSQMQRIVDREKMVYSITLSVKDFALTADRFFSNLRDELIEELKHELENEFDVLEQYISLGCPMLQIMLTQHQNLLQKLISFYDLEVLNSLSIHLANANEKPEYLIYNLEKVTINQNVNLQGIAIKA